MKSSDVTAWEIVVNGSPEERAFVLAHMAPEELVAGALTLAEHVLPVWEQGDGRGERQRAWRKEPRKAIESARALLAGTASVDDAKKAADWASWVRWNVAAFGAEWAAGAAAGAAFAAIGSIDESALKSGSLRGNARFSIENAHSAGHRDLSGFIPALLDAFVSAPERADAERDVAEMARLRTIRKDCQRAARIERRRAHCARWTAARRAGEDPSWPHTDYWGVISGWRNVFHCAWYDEVLRAKSAEELGVWLDEREREEAELNEPFRLALARGEYAAQRAEVLDTFARYAPVPWPEGFTAKSLEQAIREEGAAA